MKDEAQDGPPPLRYGSRLRMSDKDDWRTLPTGGGGPEKAAASLIAYVSRLLLEHYQDADPEFSDFEVEVDLVTYDKTAEYESTPEERATFLVGLEDYGLHRFEEENG